MIKEKHKLTPTQELSEALAAKLISRIIVKQGSLHLAGLDGGRLKMIAKGDKGDPPVLGVDYPAPKNGKDGYTPKKDVDYRDGRDGKDGYTPTKGKDYFDGRPGRDGLNGESVIEYEWSDDFKVRFKLSDGSWGKWSPPLRGVQGEALRGPAGAVGKTGACGKNGKDAAEPAILPAELIAMVSDIADLKQRIAKIERK